MKTAEEIVAKALMGHIDAKSATEALKEYAREACKEQREICANEYYYESNTNDSNNYEINGKGLKNCVRDYIKGAPEPELK